MEIIVIDDDAGSRSSLKMLLTDLHYQVFDFDNGLNAINFMKKHFVPVVLSDIRMPVLNGLNLLIAIKKEFQDLNTAVILFTGQSNIQDAVFALKNGAFDYLTKPLNFEELINIIQKAFEFIRLKNENRSLKDHFDNLVEEKTKNIHEDLTSFKNIALEHLGMNQIGVFSETLKKVFDHADILHQSPDIPVLIEGETGTGKEVIAKYIHHGLSVSTKPFIAVNAAAIPPELFESDLFGYEGGAFTGSKIKGAKGKIHAAQNGTLFLDEITTLSTTTQAKLLRLIQEKEYYPIGSNQKQITNARFIFATNDNIQKKIEEGNFRKDLYYRLKAGYLFIPPLRERKEEILPLASLFLKQISKDKGKQFDHFSNISESLLLNHSWEGNVRELKSSIERVVILFNDKIVRPHHLSFLSNTLNTIPDNLVLEELLDKLLVQTDSLDLQDLTQKIIRKALLLNNNNKVKTASFLRITRNQLYTFLNKVK